MKKPAPWPYETCDNTDKQNKAARYRYCEKECQKKYMQCLDDTVKQVNNVIRVINILTDVTEFVETFSVDTLELATL
jgi:hypothetical protein